MGGFPSKKKNLADELGCFLKPFSGKYPHLLVSASGKPCSNLAHDNLEAVINFGPMPVGSKNTKWVELHNLSPVSPLPSLNRFCDSAGGGGWGAGGCLCVLMSGYMHA